jgi:hypothetical protein
MHSGKYFFAQVTEFLPVNDFNRCVKKYNGSYKVHHFSCWHQLLCMVFGQITNRESLSDVVLCLRSQRSKWYHLGLCTGLSKSNLAYANENRNWQILDFARLYRIHKANSFFVLRLQVNQDFRRIYSNKVDKSSGVAVDQTIKLNNFYPAKRYPEKLRRIKYSDKETGLTLEFFTNNFELQATEIARLYKHRWAVELFFKWIKQHLKIRTFWGYSENAVRIQVYSAIITYVSVVIMKNKCKIKHTPYEILQILSITLLNKTPLNELFKESYPQTIKELNDKQLNMF